MAYESDMLNKPTGLRRFYAPHCSYLVMVLSLTRNEVKRELSDAAHMKRYKEMNGNDGFEKYEL